MAKEERYYYTSFPGTAEKILVRFLGFSDNVGNAGCYKVYNEATGQVLHRALLERLDDRLCKVYNVEPFQPMHANGENDDVPVAEVIKSCGSPEKGEPSPIPTGMENLQGRSFLMKPKDDGSRERAFITHHGHSRGVPRSA